MSLETSSVEATDGPTATNGEPPPDRPAKPFGRSERSLIRVQLLAPIRAVVELGEMLIAETEAQGHEVFALDLAKIRDLGTVVCAKLAAVLGPDRPREAADDPASASRVRHDLVNPISGIIGYCELWLEEAEDQFLDGFVPDLAKIRDLSRQALGCVDEAIGRRYNAAPAVAEGAAAVAIPLDRAAPPPAVAVDREPGRVLVVDDAATGRELLVRRLEKKGHRVAQAGDGRSALDLARDGAFDLILLDILMPGIDGFEVLRELKADPRTRSIPVIMITGLEDVEDVARSISLGAEDYLARPINGILLDARIEACLEKKRLHDRERSHLLQIERERRRYDELLRSILPGKVVAELQESSAVKPVRRDRAAVLFADVVGFTRFCDAHTPEQVVDVLQRLVDAWDQAISAAGVEKIKNLGDGILVACGVLEPLEDPVGAAILCGRELIAAGRGLGIGWDVRVGVDVGPVVAGVLGRRQFLFDLWGDAVNTASRVESHGHAGRVNLTARAYDCVRDRHPEAERRLVDVKGKGMMEIFSI